MNHEGEFSVRHNLEQSIVKLLILSSTFNMIVSITLTYNCLKLQSKMPLSVRPYFKQSGATVWTKTVQSATGQIPTVKIKIVCIWISCDLHQQHHTIQRWNTIKSVTRLKTSVKMNCYRFFRLVKLLLYNFNWYLTSLVVVTVLSRC